MRGGTLDAFTSRDHTSYQAHVLDADLPVAVDVLTDLVRRPLLRESDLDLERNVILEEISSVEDTPDDLVFELHAETLWPDHRLRLLDPRHARDRRAPQGRRSASPPPQRVLPRQLHHRGGGQHRARSAHDVLEREGWFDAGETLGRAGGRARRCRRRATGSSPGRASRPTSSSAPTPFALRDPRRYAFSIMTNVFGGGMSSRLFQRVREELGLAYAVFGYQQFYQTAGISGVYVGTQAETADQACGRRPAEYARLASEGLPAEELAGGKQQLKGQIMLSLESPMSRMHRLAGVELPATGTARWTRSWRRSTR